MEGISYCKECGCSMPQDEYLENDGLCVECSGKPAICLECNKKFIQERDIQLCDNCVDKFDLDRLWKMHDNNELDALDFNENKSLREQFREVV